MTNNGLIDKTPVQYRVAVIEAVILETAAELHPNHLSASDLTQRIVGDPRDEREVETIAQAIRNLREFGLLRDREDEIVEPTEPILHAIALLT